MKVVFLGTGTSQGVPVIGCKCQVCSSMDFRDNRLRSSIYLQMNDTHVVVDTGPDFRQQMLRQQIDTLDAILLTHEHKDHIAGMDDIRSYNFRQNKDMPIYGRKRTLNQIKKEFSYIFSENRYPGIPRVILYELNGSSFEIEGNKIIPIEAMHHKLPVYGFRFGDFTYVTDAKFISEEEKAKIKGSKVIVLNALQKEAHISHYTFHEAVDLMQELNPEKGYLTHISHRLGFHEDVSKELPQDIELAWDGLQLII